MLDAVFAVRLMKVHDNVADEITAPTGMLVSGIATVPSP
jgi:hypothetical protein